MEHFNHYANTSMQYTVIFHSCINDNFQIKNCDIFLFLVKTLIVLVHVVTMPTLYVLEQK